MAKLVSFSDQIARIPARPGRLYRQTAWNRRS